jgi:glycosyltransferase involved in cell wall biosynthesis
MAASGHQVRLFSVRHHAIEGVEVVSYLETASAHPSKAAIAAGYTKMNFRLAGALDAFAPDVVHAHYASTNGYIAAKSSTGPMILTVWGTDVIPKPGMSLSRTHKHRIRTAIKAASVVTSASEYMAGHVRAVVEDTNVVVVPFGVDTSTFSPSPLPEKPNVLVAKSLESRYGIEYVIEAMSRVTDSVPGTPLTIAGDGSLRQRLEGLAERSSANIRFVGRTPHRELPGLMASASVVVNPTIVDESFGVVVLEAQASGRPVVSTRVGAIPGVCIEGQTALLVPPRDPVAMADAIIDVLQNNELPDAPSLGPAFVADRFTWSSSVEQMNRLYSEVADA